MVIKEILSSDNPAELLEQYGFDVDRVDDERVWVHGPRSYDSDDREIWLLVEESDIPDIIGETLSSGHSNKGVEDVFNEYVKKREFR